jgi:hypothetical protein
LFFAGTSNPPYLRSFWKVVEGLYGLDELTCVSDVSDANRAIYCGGNGTSINIGPFTIRVEGLRHTSKTYNLPLRSPD